MTGRVCSVHGEWSATGVCRWCEDGPRVVDVGRVTATPIDDPWALLLRAAAERGPVSRQAVDVAQELCLSYEHAALRWERVARRWNYKHAGSITAVYLDWQRCADEMAERLRRMFALPEDPPP